MLHIILLIGKWIGIILGGLVGLVLLLALLVLLVPLRYRMRMVSGENGIAGQIRADWLLHGFGIVADYRDAKLRVRLKLFWLPLFCLYPPKEKQENKKRRKRKANTENRDDMANGSGQKEQVHPGQETIPCVEQECQEVPPLEQALSIPMRPDSDSDNGRQKQPEASSSGESLLRRIGCLLKRTVLAIWHFFGKLLRLPFVLFRKLQRFFRKLGYTVRKICDKISRKREGLRELMTFLEQEETQAALGKCKKQLLKMLHHVAPGKIKGQFTAGFEDPALTGQLYGLYCMACPLHRFQIRVQPDFENRIFVGKGSLRGRIRLATMLWYGLQVITDTNVRQLIRRVRNRG